MFRGFPAMLFIDFFLSADRFFVAPFSFLALKLPNSGFLGRFSIKLLARNTET
jgi:hypothetical protein